MDKKGLVLEGGGMRTIFSAGVLDVLMEHHILFDAAVGVSAGAAFGCNYKSHQIGRALRYNMKYCNDKRYCSIKSLLTTGNFYNANFCYKKIPLELDAFDFDAFYANPMKFYITCTDIVSGHPVYKEVSRQESNESDLNYFQATTALPFISKIVRIDNKELLDGGIADSVPLKFLENKGYEKNIVILTQPLNYEKKPGFITSLVKIFYRKYPNLIKRLLNRHKTYNETIGYIKKQEEQNKALVIRPPMNLNISRIENNPQKLKAVYEIGRQTATNRLDEIFAFLK